MNLWSAIGLIVSSAAWFFFKGGKKLERARDLFEQCLENCPPKFAMSKYSKSVENITRIFTVKFSEIISFMVLEFFDGDTFDLFNSFHI